MSHTPFPKYLSGKRIIIHLKQSQGAAEIGQLVGWVRGVNTRNLMVGMVNHNYI